MCLSPSKSYDPHIVVICNDNLHVRRLQQQFPWRFLTSAGALSLVSFSQADLVVVKLLRNWPSEYGRMFDLELLQNIRDISLAPIFMVAEPREDHFPHQDFLKVPGISYHTLTNLLQLPDFLKSLKADNICLSKDQVACLELQTLIREIDLHSSHHSLLSALADFDYYLYVIRKAARGREIFDQRTAPRLKKLRRALHQLKNSQNYLDEPLFNSIYEEHRNSLLSLSTSILELSPMWIAQSNFLAIHQRVLGIQAHLEPDSETLKLLRHCSSTSISI